MSLLIIFLFMAIWGAVLYFSARAVTFPLKNRKGIRRSAILILMSVCFALPILDEIQGAREFEILCAVGNVYQIAPWAAGKKYDLHMNASPYKRLAGYARPIDERTITYRNKATGEIVATSKAFVAYGGWLVQKIAFVAYGGWLVQKIGFSLSTTNGPLLGRDQCIFSESQEPRIREITNTIFR